MARDLRPSGDICCETCGEWVDGVDAQGDCDVCSQKAHARANVEALRALLPRPVWYAFGWPLSRLDSLVAAGWVSRTREGDGWRFAITALGRTVVIAAEADGAA